MRGTSGSLRQGAFLASVFIAAYSQPACARDQISGAIRVEAGTIGSAIRIIARETGAEIVTIEPGISQRHIPSQTLRGNARLALDDLFRSTEFHAVWLGGNSYRIERRPVKPRAKKLVPVSSPKDEIGAPDDVIVVQGKFPTPLHDYPGSVSRLELGEDAPSLSRSSDLGDVARRSPIVTVTAFGEGRDKIFIRGVADSSFSGAAQPTTSVYFGDTLIGFGSPNPNPKLYDVASVEILEGPQGTLFGSGSMGGVIRITPNTVDLHKFEGSATVGAAFADGSNPGWNAAGAINVPLIDDQLAVRLVAYNERQGGYIDDRQLGPNINQVDVSGGRLAIAADLGAGLRIDLGGLFQSTRARDSQYADSSGPMARSAAIPQPYSSQLTLGNISLRKNWESGLALTSVTSIGHRSTFDRFDASSGRIRKTAYDLQRSSTMLASETRIAGSKGTRITWVAGFALEYIEDGQSRALGIPDNPNALDEVTNITTSGSLFAQGRLKLNKVFEATLGLRFTMAQTNSQPARGGATSYIKGGLTHHFDPTMALLWHASPRLSIYGRFQTSYRNGGVTVARGIGKVANFKSDSIVMGEAGFRLLPRQSWGLAISGAVSVAKWKNVLAELVTPRGIPVTSNIGDARIWTVEANADWRNSSGLSLGASLLLTSNHLVGDLAMQSLPRNRLLPDAPKFSAAVRAKYAWSDARRTIYEINANGQYVGRSVLGPGSFLDVDQGDYAVLDLGLTVRRGPLSLALTVDNALNSRANRFALGNPLLLYRRDGHVPMRPRTIAVVAGVSW